MDIPTLTKQPIDSTSPMHNTSTNTHASSTVHTMIVIMVIMVIVVLMMRCGVEMQARRGHETDIEMRAPRSCSCDELIYLRHR